MIAYVDSSVLLRFVLGQPDPLTELLRYDDRVTSFIAEVECLRALESARSRGQLSVGEAADRRRVAYSQLRRMRRLILSHAVVRRASEPYPVALKTLDAIHLASALILRDRQAPDLVFATHDLQLGRAAATMDLRVIGL